MENRRNENPEKDFFGKTIRPIAKIRSDFSGKFGIPRQSNLARTRSEIHFEPEYRSREAVRELDSFSYIWLIWGFSENEGKGWHPTVRPPRLGGNARVGVFASRSPFRPNGLGLSSVRLISIDLDAADAPVLIVEGADLLDGTPIYDIKPYLPDFDAHRDAAGGYTETNGWTRLQVEIAPGLLEKLPKEKRDGLIDLLAEDPRPSYQDDPDRVYGLDYAGFTVRFTVNGATLRVIELH